MDCQLGNWIVTLVDHRSAGRAAFEVVREYPSITAADSPIGHAAKVAEKAPRWITWRWYLVTHILLVWGDVLSVVDKSAQRWRLGTGVATPSLLTSRSR